MRGRIPHDIETLPFDLIIIGAGINGAGIARDASLRGLKVLLLDKGDLASGTTSWSTRLIHGGLRYLEHGELSLVRESLRERERLFHIAPHLVRPLRMIVPIYKGSRRGPLTIRAGMIAYDLLSLDKSLERHRMLSREAALKHAPGLETKGLLGAALFYDAQVEYAERLVLENALDACEHGATALTYARVDGFILENKALRGVRFTDLLDGASREARSHVVLNVSGPWVDEVLTAALRSQSPRLVGGTKGSHLIVQPFPGAPALALYVEAQADGRPFFIIPWNGMYLIGTTDLRYTGDLDCVTADEAEIDYLLSETNRVIPGAGLTHASVVYTYSGVRPLAFREDGASAGITRRHFIYEHENVEAGRFLSVVGGKLTTYRNLSEQAVDAVFRKLSRRSPTCETAHRTLPGASTTDFARFYRQFKADCSLPEQSAERLLRIYGARATLVLELCAQGADLRQPLSPEPSAIGAEVLMSFQYEMAQTLSDCLLRRTMIGLGPTCGIGADERAAQIAQKYLGWSERRAAEELAAYREHLKRFHPRDLVGRVQR